MRPSLPRWRGVLAALAVAAWLGSGTAGAAGREPDDLARLQSTLGSAPAVRVTGSFGIQILRDVRLDSTGVRSARWGPDGAPRLALFVGKDVAPPATPPPLSWTQISGIEIGRTHAGRSARNGAILGALAGLAAWWTLPLGYDGARGPAPVVVGVPAAGGALLGALLGARHHHWTPVYPERTAAR